MENPNPHLCGERHIFRPLAEWVVVDGGSRYTYCEQHAAELLVKIALGTEPEFGYMEPAAPMVQRMAEGAL